MNTLKRILPAIAAALLSLSAWASDGVAFLTDVKGDVKIDGAARPPLMSELAKGQKVLLGNGANASVMFIQSGEEFALKGPGEFAIDKAGIITAKGAAATLRKTDWKVSSQSLVKVAQSSSASIRMRSLAPAKNDTRIGALSYPTEGAVATLQPVLLWNGEAGKNYDVSLALASDPFNAIAAGKSNAPTHRFSTKLSPDTEYVWTVNAGGTELGRGKFKTLTADNVALLEKRKPADRAAFSDRLLYAVMLNDLGATQDARVVWAKLAQERADLPELAALGKTSK